MKNDFLYNGVELQNDLELNTYQTLFRTYDPAIGRFQQIDPMADFLPGINPYNFGFDNPVSYADPTGLWPEWLENLVGRLFGGKTKTDTEQRKTSWNNKPKYKRKVKKYKDSKSKESDGNNSTNNTSNSYIPPIILGPEITNSGSPDLLSEIQELPEPREISNSKPVLNPISIDKRVTGQRSFSTSEEVFFPGDYKVQHSNKFYTIVKSAADHWKNNKNLNVIIIVSSDCNCPQEGRTFKDTGYNVNDTLWKRIQRIEDALDSLGVPFRKRRPQNPINGNKKKLE